MKMTKETENTKENMVQLNALVPESVKREVEEQAREYRRIDGDQITDRAFFSDRVCELFKPRPEFL